jgi:hypothetical protein
VQDAKLGLFFQFGSFLVAPCEGGVYAGSPLMHEPACFMRELCIGGVAGDCKCFLERELRNLEKSDGSKIEQADFVSIEQIANSR